MNHFSTLEAYCKGINISPPQWNDFDIRDFQDNMKTVQQRMEPFKHEFYAIAIKLDGEGFAKTGNFSTENLKVTVFFNSPYQILQWDIAPNWEGFYIIFSEDFYRRTLSRKRITEAYPFLLADKTLPVNMSDAEAENIKKLFLDMFEEHQLNHKTSKEIIANYLNIVL
ncbi:hypothetical protein KORDIASMS9_01084 [Kordia sp. SMS9]|uniref:hypothetical protein n=1 Tax=Kordia sp. SMS9 TaxID=2282170 RepID=UPI000E0E0498|nr:hypothetical protein [Kordia sp. SMS9]AXG68867.1 hypothetical protein KORDIASMS9_01084 [Kordia sp. SMS9]